MMKEMEPKPETFEDMDESGLCTVLSTIIGRATEAAKALLENETVQDVAQIGEEVAGAIKAIQNIRKVASIPTKLFMRRFVLYCKGVIEIPLEKRQKYLAELGKEKYNRDGAFLLNVIQKIEEEEKVPLLPKLLEAKYDGRIDDVEYRRLVILTGKIMYSDLLYLKDHITADPVALKNDADYGLAASGLLVTAGNDWGGGDMENTIRFNYTVAAKKLAHILFGTECAYLPTNVGLTTVATLQEATEMYNEVFGEPNTPQQE